jgi:hypothetical protein
MDLAVQCRDLVSEIPSTIPSVESAVNRNASMSNIRLLWAVDDVGLMATEGGSALWPV